MKCIAKGCGSDHAFIFLDGWPPLCATHLQQATLTGRVEVECEVVCDHPRRQAVISPIQVESAHMRTPGDDPDAPSC